MEGGVEMVVHFNRLKPGLSTATEAASLENLERQETVGLPLGSTGIPSGGIQSQTPLTVPKDGEIEGVVPRAEAGVSSDSTAEGSSPCHSGPSTAKDQPAPVRGSQSSHVPQVGLQDTLPAPCSAVDGEERERGTRGLDSHPGRLRRPPMWARDYQMF